MSSTSQRKIESHTIQSVHLNEERTVKVFVPHNYDPSVPLPIVYCHDGLEFFTHGRVATIANDLMTAGEIPPFLIAGIAVNMEHRRADYSMDGARHESYQKFVVDECLPMLDELYAVNGDKRLMAGISLGAVASLSFMLTYPQFFHTLILFSGAYFPPVQERIQEEPDLSRLAAYLFIGDEETQANTPSGVYNFFEYNENMRDILIDKGAEVDFHVGPGNHIWGVWQKQLPNALRWLGKHI
ncbi:alpha/beta hydrolase [Alicyclobacillus dauci]|uniref:Alpha/beta hydrolase-fold protein n=1 Tax=Alicyclobacillus dauci TaxID=1475485 RepID=A0ABY6Z2L1_9BACL|nr:alpha/beta hydrolase-fold protein [Alicyclobacillus dauci]WAH36561.1 alpha/beta hydrolase-fold protein [Alicyclobacillus dauci]